uniref:Glucoside xylosyltransferase 1 n=1 Tax=Labrus bergylta TaxID=56723 RepID=A0A3Q3FDY9_9LABR
MRRYIRALLLCMVFAVFSGLYVYSRLLYSDVPVGGNGPKKVFIPPRVSLAASRADRTSMHLAVVACGERLEETLTMIKSAVLFSVKQLSVHIFAEDQLHARFMEALESWPDLIRSRFNYTVYSISFPSENAVEWKKLFKPCASQRLFLPDVDSVVYVDSDILFLQPVDRLWHEEPRIAWYNRFARHPYYGRTGINSGVMLMNMTRMRSMFFKNDMTAVGLHQDLLNIIFHTTLVRVPSGVPCQWNYRPDHCIYGSNCASAEEDGINILHGNRGVYHDQKQPAFRAVYEAIQKVSVPFCVFVSVRGMLECSRPCLSYVMIFNQSF